MCGNFRYKLILRRIFKIFNFGFYFKVCHVFNSDSSDDNIGIYLYHNVHVLQHED